MENKIEIKQAKCKHCQRPIYLIPWEGGTWIEWTWEWIHFDDAGHGCPCGAGEMGAEPEGKDGKSD